MFGLKISFSEPWFLILLPLLLPLTWKLGARSLSVLGGAQRWAALTARSLLIIAIVLAAAGVQLLKVSPRMTVIYLLDQSASIPNDRREAMLQHVVNEVRDHRDATRGDRVGIIIFGKEALIEFPPLEGDVPSIGELEMSKWLHRDGTDLASALKLAQASFAEDTAKRIVIVTDGNENLGDARAVAPVLGDQAIGVDVVAVPLESRGEVAVEKVSLPPDIRQGQPFEARIVVNNYDEQPVAGSLQIYRRAGGDEKLLQERQVALQPGKNVYRVGHEIDSPDVYTYRAVFTATDPRHDLMVQNNEATAFTYVRGKGRVLVIEDWENPGEFDFLLQQLRKNDLEVTLRGSDDMFERLTELQGFDLVILADVPRGSAGEDGTKVTSFSDRQIQMLVHNVEQMGAGLIMLGGPNSFGAGGWTNTELEKAMPVDFQIDNDKVRAVGALVLMLHASELAQGNYWQKVVAEESIKVLGPMDYCGLIHWDDQAGRDNWLWGAPQGLIAVGGRRNMMLAALGRMAPGDMPDFEPGMIKALAAFGAVKQASAKQMIVISDGDATAPSPATRLAYQRAKIQISTVAIGTHGPAGSSLMEGLAKDTGGKYYVVTDPQALPRIFQIESRKVARPLVYEPEGGVQPVVVQNHEMHGFLPPGTQLPNISGFVFTTVKNSQLVEVSIRSPKPDAKNSTILASWQYGQGRTVAFTTDAGRRWAASWAAWDDYGRFFSQMVRWAMRPVDNDSKFTVASDIQDGKVHLAITALDAEDRYLNDIEMQANAVAPDLSRLSLDVQQVAPGRYEAVFDAEQSGDYMLTIIPGATVDSATGKKRTRAPVIAGVTVPYSAEFRDRETNLALLEALASLKPRGGEPGRLITQASRSEGADPFRHDLEKAISIDDYWREFLVLAGLLLLTDVFVRRVTLGWEWLRKLRRKPRADERAGHLDRLRSRKAELASELDQRAAARYTVDADTEAPGEDVAAALDAPESQPTRPAAAANSLQAEEEEETYTSRLMRAKRGAFKKKDD